jgi:serine/threonine-protein kinase
MNCPQPSNPWIGCAIGDRQRYVIVERIGGGGMGDVFLATDTLLGQPVALKLLSGRLLSGEMRRRFEREVAVCAALRSDHIVQVTDYGVTPEGYPFYVMEYLQGQTLGQALHLETRFSVERTIKIVTQICAGLYLAHQGIDLWYQGATSTEYVRVVHRDLKPDNIFLVPTALGEFVKILDFGIAKLCTEQTQHTHATNMFMGTLQYAAPEQFQMDKTLDERADIYSLGMILYRMLTGTDPFGFETDRPSIVAWAMAHTTKPPLPMREQPNCKQLPPELDAIVLRCLEKSPEQRPASVMRLGQALYEVEMQVGDRKLARHQRVPQVSSHLAQKGVHLMGASTSTLALAALVTGETSQVPTHNYAPAKPSAKRQFSQPQEPGQPRSGQPSASPTSKSPIWRRLTLSLSGATIIALVFGLGIYSVQGSRFSGQQRGNEATPTLQSVLPLLDHLPQLSQARIFTAHPDEVWAVAVSSDGTIVASADMNGKIQLHQLQTGALLRVLEGHSDSVRSLSFSQDGSKLASGSGDKTIKLWDVKTGQTIRTFSGELGTIWSVALSPDQQVLASGSYDGAIRIWDVQTGTIRRTLPEHYDSVWAVALSPDGNTLASGSYDSTIKIWDVQTGNLLRTLSGHGESIRAIAISPDGQTLVSGSWDKTVKVWNLQTGELLHTLSGHIDRVLTVAINDAGTAIASGSTDQTIKIWDLQTGALRHTLSGHTGWVLSVAFAPDGKTLVSGSKDKTVRQWQL